MLSVVLTLALAAPTCDFQAASNENPCSLRAILGFPLLEEMDRKYEAAAANAEASEHNIRAFDRILATQREAIDATKEFFGTLCTNWDKLHKRFQELAKEHQQPATGLTSDRLYKIVGRPEAEQLINQGPVQGRNWEWSSCGAVRGCLRVGILFTRTSSAAPWAFTSCAWCDSKVGCTTFPWKP